MMMTELEREPEYREPRSIARTRNHSASTKLEIPKAAAAVESPHKQNGEGMLSLASYSQCMSRFVTSNLFPVFYEKGFRHMHVQ